MDPEHLDDRVESQEKAETLLLIIMFVFDCGIVYNVELRVLLFSGCYM